jgi:hypothetical protein
MQTLSKKTDILPSMASPFPFTLSRPQPELHSLHPEPRKIYRLWQIFVETVNPLTKIIHVPTLQQRILDASWDPSRIQKPLAATMFSMYSLALISMSPEACQDSFGESPAVLYTRYRTASARALVDADFLTTTDLEVLQALALFLLAEPKSNLTSTLSGAAIRLGQKMGLHRDSTDLTVPFFEKEMRVRLWWQLRGLDGKARIASVPGMRIPPPEIGDVRLPLNVNDVDLHPDMTESPMEHSVPTEMLCVLMKLEVTNWRQSSKLAHVVFENIFQANEKGRVSLAMEDAAVDEIEAIYQQKYFRNSDSRIPLHGLCQTIARLAIARMRFQAHHPRRRVSTGGGPVSLTSEEQHQLFEWGVTVLDLVRDGMQSKFSPHLFIYLTSDFQIDVLIYVVSELRKRHSGDHVALAWTLVAYVYTEYSERIQDAEDTVFAALGDLVLQAWELHCTETVHTIGDTPIFIQMLKERKEGANLSAPRPPSQGLSGFEGLQLVVDNVLDWTYWDDFLRV